MKTILLSTLLLFALGFTYENNQGSVLIMFPKDMNTGDFEGKLVSSKTQVEVEIHVSSASYKQTYILPEGQYTLKLKSKTYRQIIFKEIPITNDKVTPIMLGPVKKDKPNDKKKQIETFVPEGSFCG